MMIFLVIAAIIPIIFLCYYIYKKDVNHEPRNLLAKIFILGFFSAIPILVCEIFMKSFLGGNDSKYFIIIFINTFMSIGIIEEGFKWIVTMVLGYHNKEFDEVYDIIVYAVFASLGFACIENILYVLQNGIGNAILRALISIPGHMCFGVIMGYFFAQAKLGRINGNTSIFTKNIIFSILVPSLMHALYDTFIFHFINANNYFSFLLFFVFYITMVILCFRTVNKTSRIQQNLHNTIQIGIIVPREDGQIEYKNPYANKTVNYCPICGNNVEGANFCSHCGFKLK